MEARTGSTHFIKEKLCKKEDHVSLIKQDLSVEEQGFVELKITEFPYKNHTPIKTMIGEKNNTRSFHTVNKIVRKGKEYFRKHNPINSWMSPLEAFAAGVARHIAGSRYIPKVYASINEEQQYDGVNSKTLEGFVPVAIKPLKMEDLKVDLGVAADASLETCFEAIAKMDEEDETMQAEELERKKAEKNLSPPKAPPINFEKYRTIKSLSICLMTSNLIENDDTHIYNLALRGLIDFDMALWPILFHFKKGGTFDSLIRSPSAERYHWFKWINTPSPEHRFHITENDIRNFPDLQDANPFYWPTKSSSIEVFGCRLADKTSNNDFTAEDIAAYKALKDHPVFIYHKFATLLKFILSDPNDYRILAEAHIPKDFIPDDPIFKGKNLIDVLVDHLAERIEEVKQVLINMPEFKAFLKSQGDTIVQKMIMEKYDKHEKLTAKIERLDEQLNTHANIVATSAIIDEKDDGTGEWGIIEEKSSSLSRDELLVKKAAYKKQISTQDTLLEKFNKLKLDCDVKKSEVRINKNPVFATMKLIDNYSMDDRSAIPRNS